LNVISKDNQIKTAVIQVTVDNQAPQIQITYPIAGSQVQAINGAITLNSVLSDNVGIARVEWWIDGEKVAEQTGIPYSVLWKSTKGSHQLQLKVWDTAGNLTLSETVRFEVLN
jgi:membrane carboxypeptidase/penicillin-binding protein PbpC